MQPAMRPELGEEKYAFVRVWELLLPRKDKTLHISVQNFASGVGMSRDRGSGNVLPEVDFKSESESKTV